MTAKEQFLQLVAEMTEDEAAEALALVMVARAGATPVDLYGSAWGKILDGVVPGVLNVTGNPSIEIPPGIPRVAE